MSLNAAAIAIMVSQGMNAAGILAVAEALEVKRDRTGAERQARYRERNKVTRDVTRDTVSLKEDQNPSGTSLPNEASASLPIRQPISEAVDCWKENAAAIGWPQIHSLSPNRQKLLASRLREHGIEGWRAAIAKARASDYLAGADPPSWFTFSWIIKAENFLKLTEGNYDRRHSDSADPTSVALARVQEHFRNRPPLGGAGEDAQAGGPGVHECRPTGTVVSLRC